MFELTSSYFLMQNSFVKFGMEFCIIIFYPSSADQNPSKIIYQKSRAKRYQSSRITSKLGLNAPLVL